MVITEKIRKMSVAEKFHYFLKKYVNEASSDNEKKESLDEVSKLMKGVPLDAVDSTFDVKCDYDMKATPATVTVILPEDGTTVIFDMTIVDRNQFEDAKPEATTRPIKSFLTEDEKKDLHDLIDGSKTGD